MGWFEEQLEERRAADSKALEDSFHKIAGVVLGQREAEKLGDERIVTKNAIDEILKFYHLKPVEVPDDNASSEEQIDYCLRYYGMMRRNVELTEGWYKDGYGPLIGFRREDGMPVALLPDKVYGYFYRDSHTLTRVGSNLNDKINNFRSNNIIKTKENKDTSLFNSLRKSSDSGANNKFCLTLLNNIKKNDNK